MDWFFQAFFDFAFGFFQQHLLSLTQEIIQVVLSVSDDFWGNPIILYLLSFSSWINGVVLAVSLLFLIFDIVEEAGGRGVDWGMVFGNLFKALVFVFCNRWLALLTMYLGNMLVENIDLRAGLLDLQGNLGQMIGKTVSGILAPVTLILLLIVSGIFFVVALRRFGAMLLHIFTSAFYSADIVRGDTTKMGEWLRQMVAISCTFVFQYLFYYLGVLFTSNGNYIMGITFWICVPMVSRTLQRYGYSTGTSGTLSAVGRIAGQGLSRMILK